jgi:hypothetical protein
VRAAVLVGVARTGGLPELQGVPRAVAAMEAWALGQGMSRDDVLTVVDSDGGSVTSAAVFSAVQDLVSRGTLDQLVLYFAGHGINNAQNELWLLSGAPENPNEAVNVSASAVLARRCGVRTSSSSPTPAGPQRPASRRRAWRPELWSSPNRAPLRGRRAGSTSSTPADSGTPP